MRITALVVFGLLVGTQALGDDLMDQPMSEGYCLSAESGYCSSDIIFYDLKSTNKIPLIKANCAPSYTLEILLPSTEKMKGKPSLGDTDLFSMTVDTVDERERITIQPVSKAGQGNLLGKKTNLQINLEDGISIMINLRTSKPEFAVQKILFNYPEKQQEMSLAQRLEESIRKRMETEYKARYSNLDAIAYQKALSLMARSILKRIHCTDLSRRAMIDLLQMTAGTICQAGDYVFIKFDVRNRARDLFMLGKIELVTIHKDQQTPLDAFFEWQGGEDPQLHYNQKVDGVAIVPVTEETSSAEYGIQITESAGKKRVVLLRGLEF